MVVSKSILITDVNLKCGIQVDMDRHDLIRSIMDRLRVGIDMDRLGVVLNLLEQLEALQVCHHFSAAGTPKPRLTQREDYLITSARIALKT